MYKKIGFLFVDEWAHFNVENLHYMENSNRKLGMENPLDVCST